MKKQYGLLYTWTDHETGEHQWAFKPVKLLSDDEIIQTACDEFYGLIKKEERPAFIRFAKAILRKAQE